MELDSLVVKYRPKNLKDIIGQEVPVKIISNSFKNKNLHHAYILSGGFGGGKTSTGRIMAAMENCENGPTQDPCGKCKNCIEIFEGKSLDVKEIDAASNRGIDDIRALKEEIMYSPLNCRTKYVIIDESHSLTGAAAEASLKMIEEPPPNVRFLLLTTEPEAFKPTIHSRCITLNFEKIDWCQLYNDLLLKISKLENIDIEEDALKFAAKRAKGSARNALQNLQTLISFAGKEKITLEMAQKVLGSVDDIVYYNFIQNIVAEKPNPAEAIKLIDNLITKGKNSDEIINGLEYYLRNLVIVTLCKENVHKLSFTTEELKRLENQSSLVKVGIVSKMIAFLIDLRRGILVNMDLQVLLTKFVVDSIIEVIKGRAKK